MGVERAAEEAAGAQDHDPLRHPAHRVRLSQRIGAACRRGWATSMCHTTAWNASACAVTRSGAHGGDDHARVRHGGGESAVAADDGADPGAHRLGVLERPHQVDAHLPHQVAPAHREHEHAVARAQPAHLEPVGKRGVPAVVIDAGGQLRYVVGGRIGLEARDLPEVVHRVRGIARATADAQHEEPATAVAGVCEQIHQARDRRVIDPGRHLRGLREKLGHEVHVRSSIRASTASTAPARSATRASATRHSL